VYWQLTLSMITYKLSGIGCQENPEENFSATRKKAFTPIEAGNSTFGKHTPASTFYALGLPAAGWNRNRHDSPAARIRARTARLSLPAVRLTTPHASLWASSEREVGSHVLRVRHAGERPQQLRSLSRQHGVEVWVGTATADERRRNRRCMADAFSAD